MLPRKDSNLDKEIQNLSCYRYTTRQNNGEGEPKSILWPDARGWLICVFRQNPDLGRTDAPEVRPYLLNSVWALVAQSCFGSLASGFHLERLSGGSHHFACVLDHFVDRGIVVAGIVMKQDQFPDVGIQRQVDG
jgi:hypothetical protein